MSENTSSFSIPSALTTFFEKGSAFTAAPGTIFIKAHESPLAVYYLTSGVIKQSLHTTTGNEIIVNMYKPPAFFPLTWALTDASNRHTYQSITKCTGFKVAREEVRTFLQQQPEVLFDLTHRLLKGLDALLLKTEHLMAGTARSTIALALLQLSQLFNERFALHASKSTTNLPTTFSAELTTLVFPVTHQELAQMTGLSRETVTRELTLLQKEKIVSLKQQQISIYDFETLFRLATEL